MKRNNFVSLLLISMSALMMACSNTPFQSTTPQTPTTSVDEKRKQIILDNTFKKVSLCPLLMEAKWIRGGSQKIVGQCPSI